MIRWCTAPEIYCVMDERTDGWRQGQTDGQMDGHTDGKSDI